MPAHNAQGHLAMKTPMLPAAILKRGATDAKEALPARVETARRLNLLGNTLEEEPRVASWIRDGISRIADSFTGTHVWFNSPLNSAIDITPYSQIYGIHPRFFNFDENGNMQVMNTPHAWQSGAASPLSHHAPSPSCAQGAAANAISSPFGFSGAATSVATNRFGMSTTTAQTAAIATPMSSGYAAVPTGVPCSSTPRAAVQVMAGPQRRPATPHHGAGHQVTPGSVGASTVRFHV